MSTATQAVCPINELVESKYNSRKVFDKEQMAELIASIKEKGIQVPLIVRPLVLGKAELEIVAGARRFRAAKELGLSKVPIICRVMTDEEAREVQIIENLQRADLHPLEEAQAFGKLAIEHKLSLSDVGLKVGKPERYVRQRMVLTNLIAPIADAFEKDEISIGVAFVAAREIPEHQKEFAKEELRGDYVPDEDEARRFFDRFHLDLAKAPFDTKDEKLVPQAGACTTCPKRTGNSPMLFPEIKSGETCTDAVCFGGKVKAFVQIQVKANPKAVKLSAVREYTNEKVIGEREWVPAGNKPCNDIKPGVVIQRDQNGIYKQQDVPLGKALDVCVNPKCKIHWSAASSTTSNNPRWPMSPEEKKRRAAERIAVQVDELAFNQMVASLRKLPRAGFALEDLRRVALSLCNGYSFKYRCNALAPAFGLKAEGKTDSQSGADGQENLGKFLRSAKAEDCIAFLIASELTDRQSIRKQAKRFGVNVSKIQKDILKAKAAKVAAKAAGKPQEGAQGPKGYPPTSKDKESGVGHPRPSNGPIL